MSPSLLATQVACPSHLPCPACSDKPALLLLSLAVKSLQPPTTFLLPWIPEISQSPASSLNFSRPTRPSLGSCRARRLFTTRSLPQGLACHTPVLGDTPHPLHERMILRKCKAALEGDGWQITPRTLVTCNGPLLSRKIRPMTSQSTQWC